MASPSDDIEPESPEEGEEEIIESGFDALAFWDQYRNGILVIAAVLIVGVVGYVVYQHAQEARTASAAAALAQAKTDDDYHKVMDQYPGTVAAGNAALALGGSLRAEKKYDEAIQALQDFVDKYPKHPLVSAGELGIAETLEAQGKKDEAIGKYQEVAAKYQESFSAPIAVIAQANLLKSEGKIEEARRLFENFQVTFPESVFQQEVMQERMLHAAGARLGRRPEDADQRAIAHPDEYGSSSSPGGIQHSSRCSGQRGTRGGAFRPGEHAGANRAANSALI